MDVKDLVVGKEYTWEHTGEQMVYLGSDGHCDQDGIPMYQFKDVGADDGWSGLAYEDTVRKNIAKIKLD